VKKTMNSCYPIASMENYNGGDYLITN